MTNRLAAVLAILVCALLILNFYMGWQVHLFLARKIVELTEYMAFWR